MKKHLLCLLTLSAATFCAAAADPVVEDWTKWAKDAVTLTDNAATVKSSQTNITYKFYQALINSYNNANYLMVYGSRNTASGTPASVSFSLSTDCAKIEVVANTGSISGKAANALTLFCDDKEIETKATNVAGATVTFIIPEEYQEAGTTYMLANTDTGSKTKANSQFTQFKYYEPSAEPQLEALDKAGLAFAVPLHGTQTKTASVMAANLTAPIAVALNNTNFASSSSSITTSAETTYTTDITFTGESAGSETATLTFSSGALTTTTSLSAITAENEGTEANPLSVLDVLNMASLNAGPFYVKGKISKYCAANASGGVLGTSETIVNTNIVLEDGADHMIGVALAGDAREALNLVDNPDNVGAEVVLKGSLENYYSAPGMRNVELVTLTPAGISSIGADAAAAPAEYYNLQGIRVANPTQGIFIVRQGDKVCKVAM